MKPIRVAMIRCDSHAMYFGPMMDKHDPILLSDPMRGRDIPMRSTWQRGSGHFLHYHNYGDRRQMTSPSVNGFQITKLWDDLDPTQSVAHVFSEVFYGRPQVCQTQEEALEDVDLVFISDCTGEGRDHLKLAAPGLKRGIPTFIDKPLAYDVKDAREILNLSEKYGAPVLSASILRAVPNAKFFRDRLAEIAPVEFGTVKGGNKGMGAHIHGISLAQCIFGAGVEAVYCMGIGEVPGPTGESVAAMSHVLLDYGGSPNRPKAGVMINNESGGSWMGGLQVSAHSINGTIHSDIISLFDYPWGAAEILKSVVKMVRTGKPQSSYEEMLECIAIAEAARIAQKTGRRVTLDEVLKRVKK